MVRHCVMLYDPAPALACPRLTQTAQHGAAPPGVGSHVSPFIMSYETSFSGLMDVPHLMDNLTVDHRRVDNAARYPQLHSPSNNEGIYISDKKMQGYFIHEERHEGERVGAAQTAKTVEHRCCAGIIGNLLFVLSGGHRPAKYTGSYGITPSSCSIWCRLWKVQCYYFVGIMHKCHARHSIIPPQGYTPYLKAPNLSV